MRKSLAVLSVTGLAAVALSASASSPAVSSAKDTITFSVTEQIAHETNVNVNRRGFIGDEYIFTSKLFIRGERVGHAQGICVSVSRGSDQCDVTTVFNPVAMKLTSARTADVIQLSISGSVAQVAGDATLAVNGGTNVFEGVSGQVTGHSLSNSRNRLFFELFQPVTTQP